MKLSEFNKFFKIYRQYAISVLFGKNFKILFEFSY